MSLERARASQSSSTMSRGLSVKDLLATPGRRNQTPLLLLAPATIGSGAKRSRRARTSAASSLFAQKDGDRRDLAFDHRVDKQRLSRRARGRREGCCRFGQPGMRRGTIGGLITGESPVIPVRFGEARSWSGLLRCVSRPSVGLRIPHTPNPRLSPTSSSSTCATLALASGRKATSCPHKPPAQRDIAPPRRIPHRSQRRSGRHGQGRGRSSMSSPLCSDAFCSRPAVAYRSRGTCRSSSSQRPAVDRGDLGRFRSSSCATATIWSSATSGRPRSARIRGPSTCERTRASRCGSAA
jgi:hypothetical protein